MGMRVAASAVLAAALVGSGGRALRAQSSEQPGQGGAAAAPGSTLKVDARLVNVPVVVHDKRGALVQNLGKENFVLQVDGSPQTIRYFNIDKDLPLTLGLVVDTSLSQRSVIEDEQKASEAFLDDMLNGPKDRDKVFVIEFAQRTESAAGHYEFQTETAGGAAATGYTGDTGSVGHGHGLQYGRKPRRTGRRGNDVV